jgi:hypothetical protein
MSIKLVFTSLMVLTIGSAVSGFFDRSEYKQEGENFQKQVDTLNQTDIKREMFPSRDVALSKADKVKGKKGYCPPAKSKKTYDEKSSKAKSIYPGKAMPISQSRRSKSMEAGTSGPLNPANTPAYVRPDFDKGFHQQQLREMDQRAQNNVMQNERSIQGRPRS